MTGAEPGLRRAKPSFMDEGSMAKPAGAPFPESGLRGQYDPKCAGGRESKCARLFIEGMGAMGNNQAHEAKKAAGI